MGLKYEHAPREGVIEELKHNHSSLAANDPESWASMQADIIESDMGRSDIPFEGTKNVAEAVKAVSKKFKDRISQPTMQRLENVLSSILKK